MSDPIELPLRMVVSHLVGAENPTRVLWKSRQCFHLLWSHLSNPCINHFIKKSSAGSHRESVTTCPALCSLMSSSTSHPPFHPDPTPHPHTHWACWRLSAIAQPKTGPRGSKHWAWPCGLLIPALGGEGGGLCEFWASKGYMVTPVFKISHSGLQKGPRLD